jgi:hypothetical protein
MNLNQGDNADEDELDAPMNGRRVDATIGIPRTSLAVRMYNPVKGSKPEQAPPDVEQGAGVGCSGAGPGGSILRSLSSPAANVSDPKVNWMPRGNFMSKFHGAMVFLDGSYSLPPSWRASVDIWSSDIWIRIGRNTMM